MQPPEIHCVCVCVRVCAHTVKFAQFQVSRRLRELGGGKIFAVGETGQVLGSSPARQN